ncbi:hypothetical protein EDD15DRAFT_2367006 [Pisolithus albus]|nr:hypothetical protein EDD15DRAFT_2367006 [Pisolithus albus]
MLPTGEEIPREALGPTLQARLNFWALARGPGGTAVQVKSPPSSSEPSPPLVCPRGDLETTPEPPSSLRAPASPSRVSQPPSSTPRALDRKLRSFEPSPSQILRLIPASQRVVSPSRVPPPTSSPVSPSSHLPRPVLARGRSRLQSYSLDPPQSPSKPLWHPPLQVFIWILIGIFVFLMVFFIFEFAFVTLIIRRLYLVTP